MTYKIHAEALSVRRYVTESGVDVFGVWELRIDWGPGYRVYFGRIDATSVLLLGGGDKRSQTVDIPNAVERLRDFKRRSA